MKLHALGTWAAALLAGVLIFYAVFFLWPMADSLRAGVESLPASLHRLSDNPNVGRIVGNTIIVGFLTTGATVVLAYFCAFVAWRAGLLGRAVIIAFVLLPFWTGVVVKNFAWTILLQDSGVINDLLRGAGLIDEPLRLLETRSAVVIGMTHHSLPYAVFPILASMLALDRRLENAAESLGATRWQVVRYVILPLTVPGVSAAALLVFIISLGFFITPVVLGGPGDLLIANLIEFYARKTVDFQTASTLSLLLTAVVAVLVGVYQRLPKEGQYGVI